MRSETHVGLHVMCPTLLVDFYWNFERIDKYEISRKSVNLFSYRQADETISTGAPSPLGANAPKHETLKVVVLQINEISVTKCVVLMWLRIRFSDRLFWTR
jgi:hypothetical protein